MNKICTKCGQEKDISCFQYRKKDNCYRGECKSCRDVYNKQWADKHPERHTIICKKALNNLNKKIAEITRQVNKIKEKGCSYCGYKQFPECIQFHHIDPSVKEMGIGDMIGKGKKLDAILKEIEKCILLCVNCHLALHNGDIKL